MNTKLVGGSGRRGQRGQALALVGIGMIFLVGFAVIGIDVARIAFTATEVQSIADATATAGAGALAMHAADPLGDATAVAQQNYVDGRMGSVGPAPTNLIKSITPGIWNFPAKTFTTSTWTDPNTNAVKASGVAIVDNLVAAAIGFVQSDVERQAIAAAGGACTEVASLPIAIEQDAIQDFLDAPDCTSIPATRFFQVPTDNTCFTSLSTAAAGAATEKAHIPATCVGQGNGNSGGGETATLTIGDPISLNTGQDDTVLKAINGCLNASPPLNEFVVPVIPANSCCGGCTQNVTAFARIVIDHVVDTGNSAGKGVFISSVCREKLTGTNPGCITGGENAMALIQ